MSNSLIDNRDTQRLENPPFFKLIFLLKAVLFTLISVPAFAQGSVGDATIQKGASGLPIPRFVSLKSDRINLRQGPSKDHNIIWIYRRAGLPVEIIGEFERWRRVRDAEGNDGWIYFSLLSGRRTVLIVPWSESKISNSANIENVTALRASKSKSAEIVATMEAGVLANINECDGSWCHVSVDRFSGWIQQEKLWGVYRGETVK